MTGNQQGGILSKALIIPAGVVVILGAFFLGYQAGKRQAEAPAAAEKLPSLPEVISDFLPKKEDLTFYRTLTEKGERTVSIELPPRPQQEAPAPAVKTPEPAPPAAVDRRLPLPDPSAGRRAEQAAKQQPAAVPPPALRKEQPAAKTSGPAVRYTIQTGAYSERAMAEEEVRDLKRRGYAAFLVATNIPQKGTWYRVRIGSFSNKQSAEKLAGDLRAKEGIHSIVSAE
jgi:cell division septation protein DedD